MKLEFAFVPEAMDRLRAGDAEGHNHAVAKGADALAHCSAVMLAQFSMAQAREAVAGVIPASVLSSPESAVRKLRRLVTGA